MGEMIIGHLVGDYILQNDWMAINKKRSTPICVLHCALWAASVLFFTGWGWEWFGVLLVAHFVQDRWSLVSRWMDMIGQKQFRTGLYAPWSMVVVDNVLHLAVVWGLRQW